MSDSSSGSSSTTAPSTAQPQPQEPTAAEAKKWKLKANGQEREYTEQELLKFASLGVGANTKFEEAARIRKQAEQLIRDLQSDPIKVLSNPKLGVDFRKVAEDYLYSQISEEQLSPEQKRQKELEEELNKYRSKEQEEKTRRQQEQELRAQQHYEQHYDRLISEGLSKSGLPKTANTVRSVAKYLNMALDAGYEATVDDIIPLVKQDYLNTISELFGASDGDMLLSLLGSNADKIRKADLARLRGMQQQSQPKSQSAPTQDNIKPRKPLNKYEAMDLIKKKMGIQG